MPKLTLPPPFVYPTGPGPWTATRVAYSTPLSPTLGSPQEILVVKVPYAPYRIEWSCVCQDIVSVTVTSSYGGGNDRVECIGTGHTLHTKNYPDMTIFGDTIKLKVESQLPTVLQEVSLKVIDIDPVSTTLPRAGLEFPKRKFRGPPYPTLVDLLLGNTTDADI